jgi:hypothetical protein
LTLPTRVSTPRATVSTLLTTVLTLQSRQNRMKSVIFGRDR